MILVAVTPHFTILSICL